MRDHPAAWVTRTSHTRPTTTNPDRKAPAMFRAYHPATPQYAPYDNHVPGATVDSTDTCCDLHAVSWATSLPGFRCTRHVGHDGNHQAGIRDVQADTLCVVAEWDNDRDTDGLALA